MEHYLQLKKSNCKNCYKCIRNCPVKSIRFSDNQANIVSNECILCGNCFIVCPQNAKQVRNDLPAARALIASGAPVYASIAPSFIANFSLRDFGKMETALKQLGFAGAEETAIGATLVKKEYEKMISSGQHSIILSSCCPTVNTMIEKYYPDVLQYLAPVLSPMQAHCKLIKEQHPEAKTIFIGPCISKKAEADAIPGLVDCALTFEELSEWMEQEGVLFEAGQPEDDFGRRARYFPTTGGIIRSMFTEDTDFDYIAVDGLDNCISAIQEVERGAIQDCFIELSACVGSCINGPVMNRSRQNRLNSQLAVNNFAGSVDFETPLVSNEDMEKRFSFSGPPHQMPGNRAIEEVLAKMGKHSPEDELNCGSCGYNTCREKAIAVCMGKADLSMCLPYLKEKAESFSDTIISNTPNVIIVMNEALEVQQVNEAAVHFLGLKQASDIVGEPIVHILNPAEYMNVMLTGKNVYEKPYYLAEYERYVEETIIYDKAYKIIITLMRDVTEETKANEEKTRSRQQTAEIADKVIEKQMRVVQEIASLLGETTAETKIALTELKESLQ